MDWSIQKAIRGLSGEVIIPPDKSISHRAIMLGALAKGPSHIHNFLFSQDCMRTLNAFRDLGLEIMREKNDVVVMGSGKRGLNPATRTLFLGNSGTSMRIMTGILAGQCFTSVLTGDESLSKRPMSRVIEPLRLMGADVESVSGGYAPIVIGGKNTSLNSINYVIPVASAQVKSAVLCAGLYATGETVVTEPFQSRDHTERMLEYLEADIKRNGRTTIISDKKELKGKDISIPGDISSAAFFMVGALILEGSEIVLKNVGINPTRRGIIDVLMRMGASIELFNQGEELEPYADVKVRYSQLKGTVVREEEVPLLIDEIPILVIASIFAEGKTIIEGINELKVKETDRVKSIIENCLKMGVDVREENNSLIILGGKKGLSSAEFDSFGDHRIAMAFAVASIMGDSRSIVKNVECVDTSYPGFINDFENIMR